MFILYFIMKHQTLKVKIVLDYKMKYFFKHQNIYKNSLQNKKSN